MGKWKKDNKEIDYIKIKRVCYKFDPISSSNALIKRTLNERIIQITYRKNKEHPQTCHKLQQAFFNQCRVHI